LLQTPAVVYCAIDSLISPRGRIQPGFDEFSAALDLANVPAVWVTSQTRFQVDDPRRKIGHNHPFIAEGGCGSYLPEGYFHLRPAKTLRLGRFTCIPAAEPQPAASEALEALSSDTGVPVVALSSLPPRELAQNSGLPAREAELSRHHDFDEVFFFAGASDQDVARFLEEGRSRKLQLRQHGALWSLAAGASIKACVRELGKLYDRALRYHPVSLAIALTSGTNGATSDESAELLAACDRSILLTDPAAEGTAEQLTAGHGSRRIPLAAPDAWEQVLAAITPR